MQTEEAPAGSGLAPRQIHILMIAVMTGLFLAALDATIVTTAIPTIVGDLGNLAQAPWVAVTYQQLWPDVALPVFAPAEEEAGQTDE